jgi:hypothetical protein
MTCVLHSDCHGTRCDKPRRGGIFAVLAERPNRVHKAQKEKEHG